MPWRTLPFAFVALLLLGASPASALVIGMSPDPALSGLLAGEQFRVDFLGATEGTIPTGGTVLAGSVDPADEVIVLRYTSLGSVDITSAGVAGGGYAITAIGEVAGGVPTTLSQLNAPDSAFAATDGIPQGSHIDLFFALSGLSDDDMISLLGYGEFAQGVDVILSLPEPSAAALLLVGAGLLRSLRRRGVRGAS